MGIIIEKDLKHGYAWRSIEIGSSKINGVLDDTIFDSYDGREMIYLLNEFGKINNVFNHHLLEAELLLRGDIPKTITKQIDVVNWLLKTFKIPLETPLKKLLSA